MNIPPSPAHIPNLSRLPAQLRVREYDPADLDACAAIYRSNLHEFLPDTLELFVDHLTQPFSYFLVIESQNQICACGGLDINAEANDSGLTFGMVRRDLHHCGIGSLLTLARLALLDGEHDPAFVGLETTLAVEGFYRRFAFERLSNPEQRYAGGSYYVGMGRSVAMPERDRIRALLLDLPIRFDLEYSDFVRD